ncbi:hypothetical protein EUTSA_v10000473mg [Eutrema salsugineum]|uniref:DYW domain-containing protein n=1 Tax=Eutrema salsugineum TaxID=72664 RepID=V4NIN7_EUTSA|nr:hypothetical protein EUTSA_v10000473mg [Eutrema salsugineum]
MDALVPHCHILCWNSAPISCKNLSTPMVVSQRNWSIVAGLVFSVYLMNNLMNVCSKTGYALHARKYKIVDQLSTKMPLRTVFSWNTVLSANAKRGDMDSTCEFFDQLPQRDLVSWTTINVGSKNIGQEGIEPTQFMLTTVLASVAATRCLDTGKKIYSFIIKLGLRGNQMAERDIITCNSMISGYNQYGYDLRALNMFSKMLMDSLLSPDRFTWASVLSACANLEKLSVGKQIHLHIITRGFDISGIVLNTLILMYSRCGGVETARRLIEQRGTTDLKTEDMNQAKTIFDLLKDRDVVVWTAIIVGYEQHGLYGEAMNLFRSMVAEGQIPNMYTLAAMLSVASSLASLESMGMLNALITMYAKAGNIILIRCKSVVWSIKADRMKNMDNIEPTLSHYACMVNMFGHAGLLQEAHEFIEKMLIMPDVVTWGSLLSAYRVHKNVEFGKVAAERLLLIEPGNSVAYSALATQLTGLIYITMKKIWDEIKKMSYVFDAASVLHDLEEEVKEQILRHHSEKLAIAYEREIIVRDTTRFHHFKDRFDSCRNY